ncbi:hypothetical protein ACQ4PT_059632 [Festuca glaucescens]
MPLVATSVVGARASQFSSSASSSARLLPALAHRTRAYRPLMTPAGSGRARLQVRAARLESTGVSVGFRGPQFELPEPMTGKIWTLDDFEGSPALLVMFICNLSICKTSEKRYCKAHLFLHGGLACVAISSNSVVTHPQDGPEHMIVDAEKFKYSFPYLYDEVCPPRYVFPDADPVFSSVSITFFAYFYCCYCTLQSQEAAKAFQAVCTPEFYLFKKDGRRPFELFYHGQFDDSRPGSNVPVTGKDLSHAIDCALSGQEFPFVQRPSVGCSIKWNQ